MVVLQGFLWVSVPAQSLWVEKLLIAPGMESLCLGVAVGLNFLARDVSHFKIFADLLPVLWFFEFALVIVREVGHLLISLCPLKFSHSFVFF